MSLSGKKIELVNNWKLVYCENMDYVQCKTKISDIKSLEALGFKEISNPSVPGTFQSDYCNKVINIDPYYADNVLNLQRLENIHVWYYCTFDIPEAFSNPYISFEGIDTVADIYFNGELVKSVDNAFIEHRLCLDGFKANGNEIVIHIKPAMLAARDYTPSAACYALDYNEASLFIRKPAHSFGWDIFPRIITSGLTRGVYLCDDKKDSIKEAFIFTREINFSANNALGCVVFDLKISGDFINDYEIAVEGVCSDSSFYSKRRLWNTTSRVEFKVTDCKLWWPKNYGEANIYKVKLSLFYKGKLCDVKEFNYGIRTVELKSTEIVDEDGNGDFSFFINNRRIFVMGMNWVPVDAMYANDTERYKKALDLLDDSGCNMVRCWGGGTYEPEEFFDFCDEKGIMVWQDFSMACALYPNEPQFTDNFKNEAVSVIKRLRNHTSLVLWCGDNECDYAYIWKHWGGFTDDPNHNSITRKILPEILRAHDFTRPFLPSSPYFSSYDSYLEGKYPPERHMWGSRQYFKLDEYKKNTATFVSETGYHGCPSVASVKRFISEKQLWPYANASGEINDEWLIHCTSMERDPKALHAFRVHLLYKGVEVLFGSVPDDLETFAKQSQISQAEALKFFVERMRIGKWNKTGIILWNLLDGWPQFSDAIVDYYFVKKLAYYYIKRSQKSVCLMFDEPIDNKLSLFGVNDLTEDKPIIYKVTNMYSGEVVLQGEAVLNKDSSAKIAEISIAENEKSFYFIKWECDGTAYTNHYFTNIIDIDYEKYMSALKQCGYDQFEGM